MGDMALSEVPPWKRTANADFGVGIVLPQASLWVCTRDAKDWHV